MVKATQINSLTVSSFDVFCLIVSGFLSFSAITLYEYHDLIVLAPSVFLFSFFSSVTSDSGFFC